MPKLLNKVNLPQYASAPSSPVQGDMYYNTTDDTVYVYDGASWLDLAAGGGGSGDITAVVAGDGLTGGATSGSATLNVGAGTGISVAADSVAIDTSVVPVKTDNLGVFAASTSAAIGVGSIELGNASDTTLSRASAGVVAVEGTALVKTDDSRLSDARTPTAHAASHASAGSDPVAISASQVSGTAIVEGDSRLTDARTPTAHATSHKSGGSDSIKLNELAVPTADVSLNNYKITSLATPSADSDAATKAYVDAVKQGLDVKDSVRLATTENHSLSGLASIDGITPLGGDRILVKNQDTASQNGIYIAASGSWSRADDAAQNGEITSGTFVFVEQGSTQEDSGWVVTTNGTIEIGATAIAWAQFSGAGQITAGTGLTKDGNTLAISTAVVATLSGTQTLSNKTLTAPSIGAATATSINKVSITAPATAATVTIADGKTFTANNTLTISGTDGSTAAFGAGGTVAYIANKLSAFGTTSSSELAGVITDETGSGSLVFNTSPSLTTPIIGSAGAAFVGSTSGTVIVQAPAVAGNGTVTFATSGTMLTSASTLDASKLSGTVPGAVVGKAAITYTAAGSASITTRNVGDIWIDSTDTTTYTAGIPVTAFDARGDLLVGTGNDTYTILPTGTAGQTLRALGTAGASPYYTWVDSTNISAWATAGTYTWTKPTGAKAVYVLVVGGGGGGGSGARINEATTAIYSGGGGGGGGGGFVQRWIDAALLPSTVTVVVGGGGTGGAQIAATSALTAGNDGGAGTASTFGSYATAFGGYGGRRGIITTGTAAGTMSAPGIGNGYAPTGIPSFTTTAPNIEPGTVTFANAIAGAQTVYSFGGWGVHGASSGLATNSGLYSLDNPIGPAGGAAGGGKSTANAVPMKGGDAGRGFGFTFDAAAAGGAAFGSGVVGGTGTAGGTLGWGNGGGGGASGGSANGGPGGAGGFGGGGGGGGGAANGTTIATIRGGAGGAGGAGLVFVLVI